MYKVEFENFKEVSERLNDVNIDDAINKALEKSGLLVKRNVSIETPVDTGTLQKNWRGKAGNNQYIVENHTIYGPFVNYGTKYITANPFVERGLQKSQDRIKVIFFKELITQINL